MFLIAGVMLSGCSRTERYKEVVHRSFYNNMWERFDYVYSDLTLKEATTFDLGMSISFTEEYPFDYFEMVFTVFDSNDDPYRAKGYKFKLKDDDGNWKSQQKDGCYTYELPINKELRITEPGTYRFQVEYRLPKTPLMGVKELTLTNNGN